MKTQDQEDKCHRCGHYHAREVNGVCRVQIYDRADIYSHDCGCVTQFHKDAVDTKVLARTTQTNPDVLMLPVLRNGELIGKMSLRREAVPTEPQPFTFAICYRVEEGKLVVYEVTMIEGNSVREYLKRLVNAGISFSQAVRVSEKQIQLQPVSLDEAVAVASGEER